MIFGRVCLTPWQRAKTMGVNYKKLWKLLIDRDMKKQDLQNAAKISAVTIAKLGRNENVTTTILAKICTA